MKYGVREICDVVLRAKTTQNIGSMTFYKDMPVLYFDSLKTSSLEGAATSVYAQGGRGNARLIAWEGERTVTFTMEDALISPVSLAVLTGAGVLEPSQDNDMAKIKHATETAAVDKSRSDSLIEITYQPYVDPDKEFYAYVIPLDKHGDMQGQPIRIDGFTEFSGDALSKDYVTVKISGLENTYDPDIEVEEDEIKLQLPADVELVMVDYYYKEKNSVVTQIEIDAINFAGNYYLEASTLWRNKDGVDVEAEFIIPNCKIQSNFTFSMAPTGDPSTFTFTLDAFPDYTKYDKKRKVFCAIRLVEEGVTNKEKYTGAENAEEKPHTQTANLSAASSWRQKIATTNVE